MPALTVLRGGGRNRPEVIEVERREYDELHIELASAQVERIAHTEAQRRHLRAAMVALANGHLTGAATWLRAAEAANETEGIRALAMDVAVVREHACADGVEGMGHGRAA
jgi:hypothetical protein